MSESNALQRLIFERLSSFAAVTAIVGTRIADAPPSALSPEDDPDQESQWR